MGQATVDLPDPLEALASPGHGPAAVPAGASADDLLSQMAGEEIDRLLSEADVKPAPLSPQSDSSRNTFTAEDSVLVMDKAALAELDVSLNATVDNSALQTQIDALFNELGKGDGGASPELMAEVSELVADASASAVESGEKSDEHLQSQLDNLFQQLVQMPAADEATSDKPAAEPTAAPASRWLMIMEKPLEWINVPFASLSEELRQTLGKVAIVTCLNSLAVITYVLLFRP
jgi:hypothetical protein